MVIYAIQNQSCAKRVLIYAVQTVMYAMQNETCAKRMLIYAVMIFLVIYATHIETCAKRGANFMLFRRASLRYSDGNLCFSDGNTWL